MARRELGIQYLRQGIKDKLPVVEEVAREYGVGLERVAYIGDDLPDLAPIQAVGLGVAVADAAPELVDAADYVTTQPGGQGAVREMIERMLRITEQWDHIVDGFAAREIHTSG